MHNMVHHVPLPWTRLPFTFDTEALQRDVAAFSADAWKPHFNQNDYEGQWSSIALRSRSGRSDDILPHGSAGDYQDTPLLATSPALKAAIDQFQIPLKSVRLLRLHAGSRVREHSDHDIGLADGELRIHIPIQTSDAVEFIVANRRLRLREGESWYIDFSQPHRIHNAGTDHRIHLVIDGTVNPWAVEMLQRSVREIRTESEEPAGMAQLRSFCNLVWNTPSLQASLMKPGYADAFLDEVVLSGSQHSFLFERSDAQAWLDNNRRDWMMRCASL